MQIVQLSDMHLSAASDSVVPEQRIGQMTKAIRDHVSPDEKILFCCCGDIVDRADVGGYATAERIWRRIQTELSDRTLSFAFVPGNHDCVKKGFAEFDAFISGVPGIGYTWSRDAAHAINYEETSLVLVNSIHHRDATHGSVDYNALENQ